MSFGGYPALSLKEARDLRDEARAMLTKGVNPHSDRKRHAIVLAGEHTFKAIYEKWLLVQGEIGVQREGARILEPVSFIVEANLATVMGQRANQA